jgi:flagellar assembly factor FliW
MELHTSRFGTLQIDEQTVYTFPKGLPGFEEETNFVIVAPKEEEPFAFLQSVHNSELAFVIADPFLFYADYDFELSDSIVAELGIDSPAEVLVRSIITVPDELDKATINLVAPIIFNGPAMTAKQVVLGNTPYTTRHPLFAAAGSR